MNDFELNPMGEGADGGELEDEDQRQDLDDLEDEGEGAEPSEGGDDAGDADRQQDDRQRQFNSAMAAARRRAEEDTRAKMQRETDQTISGMRIPNPYKPGTYFNSLKELGEYSAAANRSKAEKRAKAEGRSTEEVLQEDEDKLFLRQLREEKKAADERERQKKAQEAFVAKDIKDFQQRHPEVDIVKLEQNKAFKRFAGSRYGREPLADLYEDFSEIVGEAGTAALAKNRSKEARGSNSGSGGSSGALTSAQRAALREWNEEHPDMKMSEKEFLEM